MTEIIAFLLLIALVTIHAAWRGGAPERLAAAAMLLAAVATSLTNLKAPLPFRTVQWQLVWIDTALFAVLFFIALGAHASRAFASDILPLAYWFIVGKLAYPMLLLLVIGTERHHRRSRPGTVDPQASTAARWQGSSSLDAAAPRR